MNLTVTHRFEIPDEALALLKSIIEKEDLIMKSVADARADVAALTTVIGSAEAAFTAMAAQVAALKTTQTDPATAAAIDQLATDIEANTASLAAAVAANTNPPAGG